jgi:hypothetical protein
MIQAPEGITLYWRKRVFIIILPSQLQALEQRIERKRATHDQAIAGIRDPPVDGAADGKETTHRRHRARGEETEVAAPLIAVAGGWKETPSARLGVSGPPS